MIEPTDALRRAYVDAWDPNADPDELMDARLLAVLAELSRDYCLQRKGHVWNPSDRRPPQWPPGRGAKHPHYCVSCSNGETPGPGCINCRSTGYDQTPRPDCEECWW